MEGFGYADIDVLLDTHAINLGEVIGRGKEGVVYLVGGRAVKVLDRHLPAYRRDWIQRFYLHLQEHNAEEAGPRVFFVGQNIVVMEFLAEGVRFDAWRRRQRLTAEEKRAALDAVADMLRRLDPEDRTPVGDLHAANIMLVGGRAYAIDGWVPDGAQGPWQAAWLAEFRVQNRLVKF